MTRPTPLGPARLIPLTVVKASEPERSPARRCTLPAPRRILPNPAEARGGPDPIIRTAGLLKYVLTTKADGRLGLAPAWPLWALLVVFPVWWALGLGTFIFPISAIPMARSLYRRRAALRLPRGWTIWLLFLIWNVISLSMYLQSPPGVHPGSLGGRAISTAVTFAEYASATVTLLFVGNLRADELPLRTLARWLSTLFLTTVGGGVLAYVDPHFAFTSPVERLLPGALRYDPYIQALVHPAAAQLQAVIGSTETGRAAAPFGYTNFWANCLSLLLIWFIASWGLQGSRMRRVVCALVLLVALVPIVDSLNRGLWIGLGVSIVWVAVRMAVYGRLAALLGLLIAFALGILLIVTTPLLTTVTQRLAHPESNSIRSFLTATAIQGAEESPIVGWGGTRKTNGSSQSIAIGKSPICSQRGDFAVGSNGQLWAVLFAYGFVGTAFFLGFFLFSMWVYRHDRTTLGQASMLVVALMFVYMFVYNSTPAAFTFTMIAVGILWRTALERDSERIPALTAAGSA